jgi:hypothetical protein
MTMDDQEILSRFHRALVRELQAAKPEQLSAPFSVAEIYQNLVPYRTHRDELGVEMNGDYEHALLRLLAGEGEYLTIESRTARQEIREELESPNPNTGLYRDFAAADVRLNPERLNEAMDWVETLDGEAADAGFVPQHGFDTDELRALDGVSEGAEDPEDPFDPEEVEEVVAGDPPDEDLMAAVEAAQDFVEAVESPDGGDELASGELPLEVSEEEEPEPDHDEEVGGEMESFDDEGAAVPEASEEEAEEPTAEASDETEDAGPDQAPESDPCPWCRENLPRREGVKFCPFCGSNVKLVPCPACGEELEITWRFCVACGTEVAS